MIYLNEAEIRNLYLKNEEQNLSYSKESVSFAYKLQDVVSGANSVSHRVQNVNKLKVDGEEFYLIMDEFKNYAPFYMKVPVNSPEVSNVKKLSDGYYTVDEEEKLVRSKLVTLTGGYRAGMNVPVPYAAHPEIQQRAVESARKLVDEHLEGFKESFKNSMSKYIEVSNQIRATHKGNDLEEVLHKELIKTRREIFLESSKFPTKFDNIVREANVEFRDLCAVKDKELRVKLQAEADERKATLKKAADLKEFVEVQEAKDFLIEKICYYPVLTYGSHDVNVDFIGKAGNVLNSFKLELTDTEINYDSAIENDVSYLLVKHIADEEFSNLNKRDHKKYFHAFFDLKYGLFLQNKQDIPYLDEVVDKHFDLLPEDRDENIMINDKHSLAKVMKSNLSSDLRLEHIQKVMDETFKTKNKNKPQ